jgi:MORN repeat protein
MLHSETLLELPNDLHGYMVNFLDVRSFITLRSTCKKFWILYSLEKYRTQFVRQVCGKVCGRRNVWHKLPNGLRHGKDIRYDASGNKESYTSFQNGQYEGKAKSWHCNGQLRELSFYQAGKCQGESRMWHYTGLLQEHAWFVQGMLHGEYRLWHDNGQLREHTFWDRGKFLAGSSWDKDGRVERSLRHNRYCGHF